MPDDSVAVLPQAVCVMVRLVRDGTNPHRATIELWTPGGTASTPSPAADADLALVLRRASALSSELGLHRNYAFADQPDAVASSVRSWIEKRAALDELRVQRGLLEPEASVGAHRADGTRRTERDRADAQAMLLQLSQLRASILRCGFTTDEGGGATPTV